MRQRRDVSGKVTAIVVAHNSRARLGACLKALLSGSAVPGVIVVDYGSSDSGAAFVRENYPGVVVSVIPADVGFAHAANQGFLLTQTKYALLIDAAVTVAGDCLEKLLVRMNAAKSRRARVFAVQAAVPGEERRPGGRILGAARGAGLYRMRVLGKIGYLDERLYDATAEFDLCWRGNLSGYPVLFEPQAVAVRFSLTQDEQRQVRKKRTALILLAGNLQYMSYKYLPEFMALTHRGGFSRIERGITEQLQRMGIPEEAAENGRARGQQLMLMDDEEALLREEGVSVTRRPLMEEASVSVEERHAAALVRPLWIGTHLAFTPPFLAAYLFMGGVLFRDLPGLLRIR